MSTTSRETMTVVGDRMLIDGVMPEFDATIIEHIVIDAPPDVVYQSCRGLDFMRVHSPLLDAIMFARGLPEKIGRIRRNRPSSPPPPAMRLADLFDDSAGNVLEGWLGLSEVEGREILFGAIGKVWQPDIDWRSVTAEEFAGFAEPDYARIAVGFSIRDYGANRSLLSYEARTQGTDAAATRKFLRYWWLVRRFVHVVMRAAVVTVRDLAEAERRSNLL